MAKPTTIEIKLESKAGTGTFYITKKNPRTKTEKMSVRKYDKKTRKNTEIPLTKGISFIIIGNRIEARMTKVWAVPSLRRALPHQKGDCAEVCRSERHAGRTVKSRATVAFFAEGYRAIGLLWADFVVFPEPIRNDRLFFMYLLFGKDQNL